MKKAIALLATMAVVATTAFAQLAPSISGSAEVKWGANFDAEDSKGDEYVATGFETDTSVTVTIPLTAGETVATEDGEGATGTASISGTVVTLDLNMSVDEEDGITDWNGDDNEGFFKGTGELGDISAKINFANGAYATVGTYTELTTNLVEGDRDYDINPAYSDAEGISLGYATDSFGVEFTIVNEGEGYTDEEVLESVDATTTDKTDVRKELDIVEEADAVNRSANDDGYEIGGTAFYKMGDLFNLDLAFATNATRKDGKKTSFAAKVASTPVEGLTLTVPFDYLTNGTLKGDAMEVLPAVSYTAGAITAGTSFHYLTVAKELNATAGTASDAAGNKAVVEEVIPTGYTKVEIDGQTFLKDATGQLFVAADVTGYVAPVTTAGAGKGVVVGSNDNDVINTELKVNFAYALDAGSAGVELSTNLQEKGTSDEASDMNLGVKTTWTADTYSATVDFVNVLEKKGMDEIGIDATYSGIPGVSASVETALSLKNKDGEGDYTEDFTIDKINVDLTSELTGVENTTFTVNWSGFDTGDATGVFYVGAKISL